MASSRKSSDVRMYADLPTSYLGRDLYYLLMLAFDCSVIILTSDNSRHMPHQAGKMHVGQILGQAYAFSACVHCTHNGRCKYWIAHFFKRAMLKFKLTLNKDMIETGR